MHCIGFEDSRTRIRGVSGGGTALAGPSAVPACAAQGLEEI